MCPATGWIEEEEHSVKGLLIDIGFLALSIAFFLGVLHFYDARNTFAADGVTIVTLTLCVLYVLLRNIRSKKTVK